MNETWKWIVASWILEMSRNFSFKCFLLELFGFSLSFCNILECSSNSDKIKNNLQSPAMFCTFYLEIIVKKWFRKVFLKAQKWWCWRKYKCQWNLLCSTFHCSLTLLDFFCIYMCCFLSAKRNGNGCFIPNGSHRHVSQWSYQASVSCLTWNSPQRVKCHRRLWSDTPQETDHNFWEDAVRFIAFVTCVKTENHKKRKICCARHKSGMNNVFPKALLCGLINCF